MIDNAKSCPMNAKKKEKRKKKFRKLQKKKKKKNLFVESFKRTYS